MRRIGLRMGLALADLLAKMLPARLAYLLADAAGVTWHSVARERRALVTENLRRVLAARGESPSGPALRRLVRKAFIAHARYYAEILRAPYYDPVRIDQIVSVQDWDHWYSVLAGGVVVALPHFGNFEPYGIFVMRHGLNAMAPLEEIKPRELYEFLRDRRGVGQVRTVPLGRALRPMLEALRRREVVALVADRDLAGDGVPVTFFGHPTTMPSGAAVLALRTGTPLIVGACRRVGMDRFTARGWPVEDRPDRSGADAVALTQEVARRFEEAIAEAPEQWWGAFQPIWSDQRMAGKR